MHPNTITYICLFISNGLLVNKLIPSPHTHARTHSNSQLWIFTKFVVGQHLVVRTQATKERWQLGGGGVKCQIWRLESMLQSINAHTCQASVTYIIGGCQVRTRGANLVHPQHDLPAAMTGRSYVPPCIFITGLTWRWGNDCCLLVDEWLSGFSWIILKCPTDRGYLVYSVLCVAFVSLIRIHWLSVTDFFVRRVKKKGVGVSASVTLDMFTLDLNGASLQER